LGTAKQAINDLGPSARAKIYISEIASTISDVEGGDLLMATGF
jgi:hypothetical protein